MPLFRKKTKVYNVRIFSDHNIKSAHQFNIDVHSNIITIMQIFKQFCVGNVHAIAVQYSQNTIEASVTFNQKYIQYYKQTSTFKHKPILIPDTNVLLLII